MTSAVVDAGDGLPLTMPRLLAERSVERPDQALLVCDGDRLTYGEAERRSAELARALLAAGLGPGSRVGVLHPNGPDFVVAWLAAARVGAVTAPISTFSTGAELVGLLRGADLTALLATGAFRSNDYLARLRAGLPGLDLAAAPPLLDPLVPSLRHLWFDGVPAGAVTAPWTLRGLLARAAEVDPAILAATEARVAPSDPLVVVHTSGSTSEPKGVVHAHGPLIRHLDNLNQLRRYTPDEVLFAAGPFFWIGGLAYSLLGTLVAGATLVCSNATAASDVLDLLEHERPTLVNGFAQAVAHLPADPSFAGRDLSSIRRGNLYPILPDEVRPADPARHHAMLGMTETGSVCLASDDESEQPEHRRGSFGRPVPGFEARVVDGDTGTPCRTGETGELWIRGPFLMDGYDGRERHDTFDDEGWYPTGDLVTVDDDGLFYFRARASDMIKTAGANVSPREVEEAIRELVGLESHVVGVDDDARGQLVAALVRAPAGTAVDVDALVVELRERLSAYKVPRRIVVAPDEAVPLLSSGKLDLRALKELLRGA